MSDKPKKVSLRGLDPTQAFYLAVSVTELDGSVTDFNAGGGEGVEAACLSEAEAVQALKDLNDAYPTIEGYVFHCVPVKKIWRGTVKVSPIKKRTITEGDQRK